MKHLQSFTKVKNMCTYFNLNGCNLVFKAILKNSLTAVESYCRAKMRIIAYIDFY